MKRISTITVVFVVFSLTMTAGYWYALAPRISAVSHAFATVDLLDEYSRGVADTALSQGKQQLLIDQVVTEREAIVAPLLPSEDSVYDLSIQIESWAKASGITLTTLSLQASTAGGLPATTSAQAKSAGSVQLPAGVKQLPVLLNAAGTYDQLKAFVIGLSQLNRELQVLDITFTGTGAAQTAQITAAAFSYPPTPAATPTPTK